MPELHHQLLAEKPIAKGLNGRNDGKSTSIKTAFKP
jgi:hypothetical protein